MFRRNRTDPSMNTKFAPDPDAPPNPPGTLFTPSPGSRKFVGSPQGLNPSATSPIRIVLETSSGPTQRDARSRFST